MATEQIFERTHFAVIGDDVVCLDLDRDRYFGLIGPTALALRRWVEGAASDDQRATVAALEARGALRGLSSTWCLPARPTAFTSLLDEPLSPISLSDFCVMALRLYEARRRLRGGLAAGLAPLARPSGNCGTRLPSDPRLRQICAAHHGSQLLLSAVDKCLPRSIALVDHLRRAGQEAILILGVALRPFHAHCWAQQGTMVLNDRPEHVRAFTPILVL